MLQFRTHAAVELSGGAANADSGTTRLPPDTWYPFVLRVHQENVAFDLETKTVLKGTIARREAGVLAPAAFGPGSLIMFKDLWIRELGPDGKPLGAAPK